MPEKLYYTWIDFDHDVARLVNIIEKIDNVHLITLYRGGLPLGTTLSNILGLPLSIIDLQTRDSITKATDKEPKLIKNAGITSNQHLILVDDIFDIGLTMAKSVDFLHAEFPNNKLRTFTLHTNTHNSDLHDHYKFDNSGLQSSLGQWVVYPWEVLADAQ